MRNWLSRLGQVTWVLVVLTSSAALAEESYEPYIDHLKKELGEPAENPEEVDPFIQSQKQKLESEHPSQPEGSYTEQLRASDPNREKENAEDETFLEGEKAKLEPQPEGGAIQALTEGHSELHAKKEGGPIHHAFGFRYGASLARNLTAGSGIQLRNFNDVYGSSYAPDLSLFYEFQPFHSEIFGNIGIFLMGGVGYYQGTGQFGFAIQSPSGGFFSSTSTTKFQFFTFPITVAATYRFNLFRYLRPFVMIGPTEVFYMETRDDGAKGNRGHSEGLLMSGGVSILLDWIAPGSAFDLYSNFGIQHYYLSLEYSNLTTFNGEVNVNISGLSAGITFEF